MYVRCRCCRCCLLLPTRVVHTAYSNTHNSQSTFKECLNILIQIVQQTIDHRSCATYITYPGILLLLLLYNVHGFQTLSNIQMTDTGIVAPLEVLLHRKILWLTHSLPRVVKQQQVTHRNTSHVSYVLQFSDKCTLMLLSTKFRHFDFTFSHYSDSQPATRFSWNGEKVRLSPSEIVPR